MKGKRKNELFNGGGKQKARKYNSVTLRYDINVSKSVKCTYICVLSLCAPLHIIPNFVYI